MLNAYLYEVWNVLQELGPWLLLGITAAGILHILLPVDFVRRHLGKGTFRNVMKASLLGVPMPLCSCGVIPAAIGLKRDGASDGAAMGFLISTPQTGVDSITVSAVFLGLPFALFKVVSAFITGLLGGFLVSATEPEHQAAVPVHQDNERDKCRSFRECAENWFDFAVNDLLYSVWRWIVIGVLVSAAISTFVSEGALANQACATGLTGMLVMLLISLPLYVCATASVPIAASLVFAGMPMGTALVFLMAGPATNIATLGAVYSEFGRRVTIIYVTVIAVCSVLLGWFFNAFIGGYPRAGIGHMVHGSIWSISGAILLLALFTWFAFRDLKLWLQTRGRADATGEESFMLQVKGMSCEGCARNIRIALMPQHGVQAVDINVGAGQVTVHGHAFRHEELREAIEEAGYSVVEPANGGQLAQ